MNFTIPLEPKTKKNSNQIVIVKGRRIVIPSKVFSEYQNSCKQYIPKLEKPIDYPINLKCVYYRKSKRRVDLCNLEEAICDILTHYKFLDDDNRNIVASHDGSLVLYDKDNPRVEIEITKKENYIQW